MAERKTKWAEKEQEKKITRRTLPKEKPAKTEKVSVSRKRWTSDFSPRISSMKKDDWKVSFWILLLFFFSIALLLFSIYKVFIYWWWYSDSNIDDRQNESSIFSIKNTNTENVIENEVINENEVVSEDEVIAQEEPIVQNEEPSILSNPTEGDSISNDIHLIQDFYSHLMNNEIPEMNQLVDSPLRTSSTWRSHWSTKNIGIFTNHIINDNISLDNITLVPWSDNKEKRTRKYWYTLWYTIDTNESFNEDWEITLLDRNWKTLISEIMCKTDGCSHSPFFWPQNYNLK